MLTRRSAPGTAVVLPPSLAACVAGAALAVLLLAGCGAGQTKAPVSPANEARERALALAPRVAAVLGDPDLRVREAAMSALLGMASEVQERQRIATTVEAHLKDPEALARRSALQVLSEIGFVDGLGSMAAALRHDPDGAVRLVALETLRQWAHRDYPDATLAGDAAALLQDPDPQVRVSALEMLGSMDRAADPAAAQIATAMQDPVAAVRASAVSVLRDLGPAADAFAAAAVPLLRDPDEDVREHAARSIRVAAASQVAALLPDPDARVRDAAIRALTSMGSAAAAYVGPVAQALQDPDGAVRAAAAEALGRWGAQPRRSRLL